MTLTLNVQVAPALTLPFSKEMDVEPALAVSVAEPQFEVAVVFSVTVICPGEDGNGSVKLRLLTAEPVGLTRVKSR